MKIFLIIIGIIGFFLLLAIIDIARQFPKFRLGEDLSDEEEESTKKRKTKHL